MFTKCYKLFQRPGTRKLSCRFFYLQIPGCCSSTDCVFTALEMRTAWTELSRMIVSCPIISFLQFIGSASVFHEISVFVILFQILWFAVLMNAKFCCCNLFLSSLVIFSVRIEFRKALRPRGAPDAQSAIARSDAIADTQVLLGRRQIAIEDLIFSWFRR